MSEWILTFAFPYIKNIPHVTLDGCIKTAVRKRWDFILADEYNNRELDYPRIHDYNWEEEMKDILSHTVIDAPVCKCPLSCVEEEVDSMLGGSALVKVFDYNDDFTDDLRERFWTLFCRLPDRPFEIVVLGPEANLEQLEAEYPEPYRYEDVLKKIKERQARKEIDVMEELDLGFESLSEEKPEEWKVVTKKRRIRI
jgi:hypothetical protein